VPAFGSGRASALAASPYRGAFSGKILPPAVLGTAKSAAWGVPCGRISMRSARRAAFCGWHTSCYYPARGVNRMFESIFGIHEQALLLHGQRVGILATNLANADTPNYKACDIDFSAVLSKTDAAPLPLQVTDGAHIMLNDPTTPSADLKFRNPYQASLDGNTVEMPVEQAAFAENNVRYQASLGFINLKIAELTLAINGQ
jgi:flagellar basal-body rod protein FlgB